MRGKIAMPVIAALLVLGVLGTSALAAPPSGLESYDAGATTTAVDLRAGGETVLVVGNTVAALTSDGPASIGDGAALLLAGTAPSEAEPAKAPEGPAESQDCPIEIGSQIPDPLDTLSIEIGCVDFTAPDTEHSTSASESATIGVLGSGLSQQLTDALLLPLTDALAPLLEGLDGVVVELCNILPLGENCSVTDVVDQVTDSLLDPDGAIVTVAVAPGGSNTYADETGVGAEALANGVVVKVLPNALLFGTDELGDPNGAVTIRIAPAKATAVADPATAEITTTASVGLVTLEAGDISQNALGDLLGIGDNESLLNTVVGAVNDLVGQLAEANLLACGEGSPLEDIVCLDAAEAKTDLDQAAIAAIRPDFDFGEGTMGARASALGLRLLSVAQEGGLVSLYLADAVAAVNASPRQATPTTVAPTTTQLPKTGGPALSGDNVLPLVLALGLGTGALAIRMRRRSSLG